MIEGWQREVGACETDGGLQALVEAFAGNAAAAALPLLTAMATQAGTEIRLPYLDDEWLHLRVLPMVLNQTPSATLIPHRASMCLLDTVEYWDAERVICRTSQHRSPGNPLRANARLSSIHGIEFAAQAMAVHGGLLSPNGAAPSVGLLVSLRDCVLHCERLDVLDSLH